ncbi:hypothetical protein EDD86DRAFT_202997 [Gorgonomyces haynaldii]|nr:hypothetical protein EDD86DRAFT_202997 [Gorgonomyces haynaldii]
MFSPAEVELLVGQTFKVGRKIDRVKLQKAVTREERNQNNVQVTTEPEHMIAFRSKVVSRSHAELWAGKDGQVYFRDVGSSSGTFLNRLRLSPSGKDSRPYPLKSGDIIQLGVDYQGRQEEIYKAVLIQVFINRANGPPVKTNRKKLAKAIRHLMSAMNPHDDGQDGAAVDCCICLNAMAPYQALFLAPCSHCFHYKCVTPLLGAGYMFLCPMCRQVANLEANVASDDVSEMSEIEDDHDELTKGATIRRPMREDETLLPPPELQDEGLMTMDEAPLSSEEQIQREATPESNVEELPAGERSHPIPIPAETSANPISPSTPANHSWSVIQQITDARPEDETALTLYRLLTSIEQAVKSGDQNASKALGSAYAQTLSRFISDACPTTLRKELADIMTKVDN